VPSFKNLLPGDPAPWFTARADTLDTFAFDSIAGRYIVLCFFGSAATARSRKALRETARWRSFFNDVNGSFFAVSLDPGDESQGRVTGRLPGYRVFWDLDGNISKLYGALDLDATVGKPPINLRRRWVVLDPGLRVLRVIPFADDGSDADELDACLAGLPPPDRAIGFETPVPVLVLPNVFEADFCRTLIAYYEKTGSEDTGFMRDVGGKTVALLDARHKRRRDCYITDPALMRAAESRIRRRIRPEIRKVHHFEVTQLERYLIGCYAAEDGGHFRAHRDNTTRGTAHRRFAVSINLNAEFEGGEVSFPEFSPKGFKPPPGGAVVFSCTMLHAVSPVKSGRRFAFLPFLYDEEAAKIREANAAFLEEGTAGP
jgi:peroxiredoxin